MDLPINATVAYADGSGGHSTAVILNPVCNGITHVVLREGHFWSHQDVTFPIAQIEALPAVVMQWNER